MLTAYVSGLPINAKTLLSDCLTKCFGESVVAIEELGKDMLKTKVRLSSKNPNIILVVLDRVSTDICNSIENGLYASDKFFSYTNMADFVVFLNNKYDAGLEVPEEEETEVALDEDLFDAESGVDTDRVEELERQLDHYKFLVKNYKVRISAMERQIDEGFSSNDEDLKSSSDEDESDRLRTEILDLRNEVLNEKKAKEDLEIELANLREKADKDTKSSEVMTSNYDSAMQELTELRSKYTLQNSLIASKDKKITGLETKLEFTSKELEEKKSTLENTLVELANTKSKVNSLTVDLNQKDKDTLRYIREITVLKDNQVSTDDLKKAEDTIVSLQEDIKGISSENSALQKELSDRDDKLGSLEDENADLSKKIETYEEKVQSLEKRIEEDSESIAQLNKNALELQSKLEVNRSSSTEDISEEYASLKRQLVEMKEGVFGRISDLSLPSSSQRVNLIPAWTAGMKLSNVRFVFAGSSESRKGAYKCLMSDLRIANPKVNYLIVDLVSETSIDYVFEITRVVPGLDWFRKGGSVQPYLSKTALKNVSVLSTGLRYINDSYFLCIDWVRRLRELEESGYQVMLFCGDLSNLVGRVLHESFAGLGISVIYIHGNSIGARSLVTNLRGISNASKSVVGYFDYSPNVKKFYDEVQKTNRCKIINYVKR